MLRVAAGPALVPSQLLHRIGTWRKCSGVQVGPLATTQILEQVLVAKVPLATPTTWVRILRCTSQLWLSIHPRLLSCLQKELCGWQFGYINSWLKHLEMLTAGVEQSCLSGHACRKLRGQRLGGGDMAWCSGTPLSGPPKPAWERLFPRHCPQMDRAPKCRPMESVSPDRPTPTPAPHTP